MNELSLFSGAGGGLLATKHLLGWRTIGYVEIEKYCQEIIKARIKDGFLDDAPIFPDISTFDGKQFRGLVDIVTGGFPCQPFSVIGERKGENDERNMWPNTIRIIREIRPKFAFLENVPGLIISGYFGTILGDLHEEGYDAEWDIIGADDVGAPHRRKRLWILANATSERWIPKQVKNKIKFEMFRKIKCQYSANQLRSKALRKEIISKFFRDGHDMAHWVDRLKAIGNGQVPAVAAHAFETLIDRIGAIKDERELFEGVK